MTYHILIVEDEADTREFLDILLRVSGHTVDLAQGAGEALALLAHRRYDVIVTDLQMPGMSGEDLYRHIERDWPESAPRVVFATAATPRKAFRSRQGGRTVPILTKPYTPDRLLQAIDDVVRATG